MPEICSTALGGEGCVACEDELAAGTLTYRGNPAPRGVTLAAYVNRIRDGAGDNSPRPITREQSYLIHEALRRNDVRAPPAHQRFGEEAAMPQVEPTPQSPGRACSACDLPINADDPAGHFTGDCHTCKHTRCKLCCTCYDCVGCTQASHESMAAWIVGRPIPAGRTTIRHIRVRNTTTDRCGTCYSCRASCQCVECGNCHSRQNRSTICADCGYSKTCCACRCSVGWSFINTKEIKFHPGKGKRNKSHRYISLEVEVAECARGDRKLMPCVRKWGMAVVRDGSVDDGFEINTAPASGDKFVEQITELGDALKNQEADVNLHCGLHCHVDSRDFSFYELKKMVMFWRWVEPALYMLVHPSRSSSTYCKPCGVAYVQTMEEGKVPKDVRKKFFEAVYDGQSPSRDLNRKSLARQSKYNNARYNALNLHSWMYRGTLENRMHHGTVDTEKMLNWGMLNAYMLDYASGNTESTIRGLHTLTRSTTQPTPKQAMKILLKALEPNEALHDYWKTRFVHMEDVHSRSSYPTDP
jgi:hypothetical protein